MLIMTNLLEEFVNLFYPPHCLLCNWQLVGDERYLCLHCLCELPVTNYHRRHGNPVQDLFAGYPQVEDVTSYLFFEKEGKTQQLVHRLKYYGDKRLAEYLGQTAAAELKQSGYYNTIDLIVPIPLHPRKQRRRGYNQSEYVARGFAAVYGCPIDARSVIRLTDTESQTRKSVYERHVNVEKIFSVINPDILSGKHILLIDDVITTGATTSACIEALRAVPNLALSIFSLAIARDY